MLLALAVLCAQAAAPGSVAPEKPRLADSKRYRATAEETARIAKCIEQLSDVEQPDIGFAPLMNGGGFLPVPEMRAFQGGILMQSHGLSTSPAAEGLVRLGPKAIPALLAALSDATPTKYTFDRVQKDILSGMGASWFGHEIPTSAKSEREQAARASHPAVFAETDSSAHLTRYTFARGDMAFVALGQIVNRSYVAMRYQPTACQVINSPVHDPEMAVVLRQIWTSDDPAALLYESLYADALGDGKADGSDVFSLGMSSVDRNGAIARLVYYFPDDFVPVLVKQLDAMAVSSAAAQLQAGERRLSPTEWCESVAWSEDPRVLAALGRVVERTDSPLILLSCLSKTTARAHGELFARKFSAMLASAPVEQGNRDPKKAQSTWDARANGLGSFVQHLPERSEPLLRAWLAHGGSGTKLDVIDALGEATAPLSWAPAILRPFLTDETVTIQTYGPDYDRHPVQLRDAAAVVLAAHVPGATFELAGERTDLDRGIERLRARLDGKAVAEPAKKTLPAVDQIPRVAPSHDVSLDFSAGVLPISDEKQLYVTSGYREDGWRLDTLALDPKTGAVVTRAKLDTWDGGVVTVRPYVGDRIVCFMSDGALVVRDAKTGSERKRIATGLHAGMDPKDPKKISGLGDLVQTSDGRYVLAWTSDKVLHAFDLDTGDHTTAPLGSDGPMGFAHATLVPVEGTHALLFGTMMEPCLRHDLDSHETMKLERMPEMGWRSAWGRWACNAMNSDVQVFDLESSKPVAIDLPSGTRVRDVLGDAQSGRAFLRDDAGPIYVVDLAGGKCSASLTAPRAEESSSMSLSSDRRRLYLVSGHYERNPDDPASSKVTTRIVTFDVEALLR